MSIRVEWMDLAGQPNAANWLTGALAAKAPGRVIAADDTMPADQAFRILSEGTAIVWEGDYQNARQLLNALVRRVDARKTGKRTTASASTGAARFHAHRLAQATRARVMGLLWVPIDANGRVPLRRGPDVSEAWVNTWGRVPDDAALVSLRELLGLIGAAQWRKKGIPVPELGSDARIYPHYGVFAPTRNEYVGLVAHAPWPDAVTAWDVGTGTGVLAALLAFRGAQHVVATDISESALACARHNIEQLGLASQVNVLHADLFPPGQADLIVCNPPWLPGKPTSMLEYAVYDPGSAMLKAFLSGVASHLAPQGEAWLIMSDLAERLELRQADDLLQWIATAGLKVVGRQSCAPAHGKAVDTDDPLHEARVGEKVSLWRLAHR